MRRDDSQESTALAHPESSLTLEGAAQFARMRVLAISPAWMGLLVTMVICMLFFLPWWNQYVPPTSYGDLIFSTPWGKDYLPYRDFFAPAPPGIFILIRSVNAIFGDQLRHMMMFGVLLRVAGACSLYLLLLRAARPMPAAVATITAFFLASTDISDIPYYYNHIGAAFVLIGTCLGMAGAEKRGIWNSALLVLAGFFLCYAPSIKQTMLFGSLAGFLAMLILSYPRPGAGWTRTIGLLSVGLVAAVTINVGWLASHGLMDVFLQNLLTAPQGKGGVISSLLRPMSLLVRLPFYFGATLFAWTLLALFSLIWCYRERTQNFGAAARFLVAPASLLILVYLGLFGTEWNERRLTLMLTALGWWGSLLIFLFHIPGLRRPDPRRKNIAALGLLAFGIGYCFAVSWPLFENMAFPGFAIVLALFLEDPPTFSKERWVGAILAFAGAVSLLAGFRKATTPHVWGLWREPSLSSPSGNYRHPSLSGVRISAPASALYTAVAKVAEEKSRPGDRIYVFPNLPLLYAIANRRPATYGMCHWVDICPDFLGKKDAEIILANPPKLLIMRRDSMDFLANEEANYRDGRPSSVRDVLAAIEKIKPRYEFLGTFQSECTLPIDFWALPDRPKN